MKKLALLTIIFFTLQPEADARNNGFLSPLVAGLSAPGRSAIGPSGSGVIIGPITKQIPVAGVPGALIPATGSVILGAAGIISGAVTCIPPISIVAGVACAATAVTLAAALATYAGYVQCSTSITGMCAPASALSWSWGPQHRTTLTKDVCLDLMHADEAANPGFSYAPGYYTNLVMEPDASGSGWGSCKALGSTLYNFAPNFVCANGAPPYIDGRGINTPPSEACAGSVPGAPVPRSKTDIATDLAAAAAADSNVLPDLLYSQTSTYTGPDIPPPLVNAPVDVVLSPVTLPPVLTQTVTTTAPDGSTDTQQTTVVTTVTPTKIGTTTADVDANVDVQKVSTVTTTNNVTNLTTTNNTTTTTTPAPKTDSSELPTDYNREATQLQILKALDGSGMPTMDLNVDPEFDKITDKNSDSTAKIADISQGSMGLFNWFPQIPTASCQDPQVPNHLTGELKTVPICGNVNMMSTFITAVLCFFALVGSVRCVESAIRS